MQNYEESGDGRSRLWAWLVTASYALVVGVSMLFVSFDFGRHRSNNADVIYVELPPEEPVVIEADGRRLWRIIENLYNNAAKYAMPHTRVYVDLTTVGHMARFSIKNISEQPLNIGADELTERFIRGDVARSTEGSVRPMNSRRRACRMPSRAPGATK